MPDQAVYIVDDEADERDLLSEQLRSVALDVRTFESGEAFLRAVDENAKGCVLLDLRMRGMGGLQVQQELVVRRVHLPVIIWTAHATVEIAVRTIRDGAFDLIEKPSTTQRLIEAVQRALAKDAERQQRLGLIQDYRARVEALTERERQIAALVLDGTPSKTIAIDLAIAEKTVEVHRSRVLKKMNAGSTTDFLMEGLRVLQAVSLEPGGAPPPTFAEWVEQVFGVRGRDGDR